MTFFSIIIPTFNSGATLNVALDSCLNQTFKDFEIVIMDGISTDRTLEIAKQYKDERIKIFSEKDSGVYDAMNKAVDKAQGEFLYFLGSDDAIRTPDILEIIFKVNQAQPYDLIYGDAFYISRQSVHGGTFDRIRLKVNNISHQAIFYRRELFFKLGKYNLLFSVCADWDFNIRCFSYPDIKLFYINQIIVNYNDLNGLSAIEGRDEEFFKLLPSYIEDDIIIIRSPLLIKLRNTLPKNVGRFLKSLFGKPMY